MSVTDLNFVITTSFDRLFDLVNDSNIIIVEGFEAVGKDIITKKLEQSIRNNLSNMGCPPKVYIYRPDFEKVSYLTVTTVKNRYMLRLPILEFFSELKRVEPSSVLILDKSIFSDIVKCHITGAEIDYEELFSVFNGLIKNEKVSVVHVSPQNYNLENLVNAEEILNKYEDVYDYFARLTFAEFEYNKLYEKYLSSHKEDNINFIKYYIGEKEIE